MAESTIMRELARMRAERDALARRLTRAREALSCLFSECLDHGTETENGDVDVIVSRHLIDGARRVLAEREPREDS